MKIRDNETGEVFEYGTNIHHALRISQNGGYLMFENLQNGDGSLNSGCGGYSFVLDDGKTPEESISPYSFLDAYANIGGFHRKNKNYDWVSVKRALPEKNEYFADTSNDKDFPNGYYRRLEIAYMTDTINYSHGYYDGYKWMDKHLDTIRNVVAWKIHEPYRPERSEE